MIPLPLDDRSVDALPDETRHAIAKHWIRRTRSELQVSHVFARLGPWLRSLGAEPVVVEMMQRASAQEVEHAEICRKLAEVYGGAKVETPEITIVMPSFGCDDERLEAALHVAGLCCINETLATAYIEACLSCSTAPLAIAANRAHLHEEIDHARLGWAHLASRTVTAALREELADCLVPLLRANVPLWERQDAFLPADGVSAHGHPSHAAVRRVIHAAVRDLVLPGFRHVGIDVRRAVSWDAGRGSGESGPPT